MRRVMVKDWDDLVRCLEALDGWAFRGEPSARFELVSSLTRRLARHCPNRRLWREREERALRIFRRKAHIYVDAQDVLDDDLRCLAMMQHHGAPTRLLDFTKSPYVALFFALESATEEAALFALDTPTLWHLAPTFDLALTRDRIDPRVEGAYAQLYLPDTLPIVWFGEPARMDRRLVAQSGLFVVPGQLDAPLNRILEHYDGDAPLLTKLVLPPSLREPALRELYRMNITHATLFPDLDGLARSMAYELEVEWAAHRPPMPDTPCAAGAPAAQATSQACAAPH